MPTTEIMLALWTLLCVTAGLAMGWRMRGGYAPVALPPNPFAKKPEPPEPKKPKPQVTV